MRTQTKVLAGILLVMVGVTAFAAWGQQSQQSPAAQVSRMGFVDDWSTHHLIFSNPGTATEAEARGRFAHWYRTINDPRYIMQQRMRSSGVKTIVDAGTATTSVGGPVAVSEHTVVKKSNIKKDWTQGITSGQVQPNTFPAKYGPSLTSASCANDFVVYPTGTAGTATTASIVAYNNLYVGTGACEATNPTVYWAYNTGATVTNSPIISQDGTQVAFIQVSGSTASLVLLKGKANTTGRTVTGSLSASSPNVTITSGTYTQADVGAQISGTNIPAGDTIASLLSSTTVNLATAPTAHASETLTVSAEAVATPGVAPTAASASAYRSCTAPCMYSVSLGANDTFSAPFYDYASDDALYVGDDSGKLHKITGLFNGTTITETSPWPVTVNSGVKITSAVYDSASGYVFVGDTAAILHSVGTGTGTPSTTNGTVHGTSTDLGDTIQDAPLVDSTAGTVYAFVTTNSGGNNAVYQFSTGFTSGTGNAAATGTATGTGGAGLYLYDGTFDNVYYQSTTKPPSGNLYMVGGTGFSSGGAILYRIPIINSTFVGTTHSNTSVTVTSGTVTAADVGAQISGTGIPAGDYITAFTSPTVTLHAAATSSNTGVTFTIMGPGTAASAATGLNTSHNPWPSPLTEFCNNGTSPCTASGTATTAGTDYVFFSIHHSAVSGCTASNGNGCILAYNITNPASVALSGSGLNVNDEGIEPGCWVTSGFVVDNSSTTTGASQIYFINLNANGAGGPTTGTYTGASCGSNVDTNTIQAVQAQQSNP